MKKFKRVYHRYEKWEEIKFNMWGRVQDESASLQDAIEFTSNHQLYGEWMRKVITDWPISCENALTDYTMNRKAWLGHAAVAYAIQMPEYIVRKAWRFLTDEQKYLANAEAGRAIQSWENSYIQDKQLQKSVDGALL